MIAVTAIIKNEEAMLEKMLKSCKDIPIFVIDTGSTDGSYDLYKKYNVTWKKYSDWDDCIGTSDTFSFSKARNESLALAGDVEWRIILDADEYLKGNFVKDINRLVKQKWIAKYDMIGVKVETDSEILDSPRVLRNIPEIFYEDIVHNRIVYSEQNKAKAHMSGLEIRSGYSPNHKIDPERTVKMLERAIKEEPDKERFYYYLAREYMTQYGKKKLLTMINLLEHYCYLAQSTNEKADARLLLAIFYLETENSHRARWNAWEALKIIPTLTEAWRVIYQLGVPKFRDHYKKIMDISDNDGALTIRKAE